MALTGVSAGRRRTAVDRTMRSLSFVAALLCVVPLGAVLVFVAAKGLPALSLDLITKGPKALGVGGGAANAVLPRRDSTLLASGGLRLRRPLLLCVES